MELFFNKVVIVGNKISDSKISQLQLISFYLAVVALDGVIPLYSFLMWCVNR